MTNGKTFVKITNQQIYDRLGNLEEKLIDFSKTNEQAHDDIKCLVANRVSEINQKQFATEKKILKQSGTVNGLKVTMGILITLLLADLGWLISHIATAH